MALGNYNKVNAEKVINFFRGKGYTDIVISAILSNWYTESGIDPYNAQNSKMKAIGWTDEQYVTAVNSGAYHHPITGKDFGSDGIGFGLAQWTSAGRKAKLLMYCAERGKSIADIQMQLEFAYNEINSTGYANVRKAFNEGTDLDKCARIFMTEYERPASYKDVASQDKRVNNAFEFYNVFFKTNDERVEENDTTKMIEINPDVVPAKETDLQEDLGGKLFSAQTFCDKLLDVARNYKTLYAYGAFGAPASSKNKTRYTTNHYGNGKPLPLDVNGKPIYSDPSKIVLSSDGVYRTSAGDKRRKGILAATADTFMFDCVNLIKGLCWNWNGNPAKSYGGASYKANNVPDLGADGMIKVCTNVSTNFTNIQPGEAVHMSGHIGVYVGNGMVVECTPKWTGDVQISYLGNIKAYKIGNYRVWKDHGKLPWIKYPSEAAIPGATTNPYPVPTRSLKKTIPTTKGEDVKWLQWYLVKLGYLPDENSIDGSFGGKTDKAFRKWQSENYDLNGQKLTVDGSCGKKSREKLLSLTDL